MVGGAVRVGDFDGAHAQTSRQGVRRVERARVGPGDRAAGAAELGPGGGHGHQRVQAEGLVAAQHVEAEGAGAVPDQPAGGDALPGRGDLAVGDAQQDAVGAGGIGPAAEGAIDRQPGVGHGGRERRSQAALTHDRPAGGEVVSHVGPVLRGWRYRRGGW